MGKDRENFRCEGRVIDRAWTFHKIPFRESMSVLHCTVFFSPRDRIGSKPAHPFSARMSPSTSCGHDASVRQLRCASRS